MPIPIDARQVPGNENRVVLGDGRTVTRASALNMGASQMGYKNHNDWRKNGKSDLDYSTGFLKNKAGRKVVAAEKKIAKEEGRRYSASRLRQKMLTAIRGKKSGTPAGRALYTGFMRAYGLLGANREGY